MGFGDTRALKDAAAAAHELLLAGFAAARPGDGVLSEEGSGEDGRAGTSRLDADWVWIVDPPDGAREFSEGRSDWAVHVALWERSADDLTLGVVALPARGWC